MHKLRRALLFVWQSAPRLTIAKVCLMVVQGLLPLLLLYINKLVIDAIATYLGQPQALGATRHVISLLAFTAAVTLVITFTSGLENLVSTIHAHRVTEFMETVLHSKAIAVDLDCYEDPEYYDTLQRAEQEATERPTQVLNLLTQIGQNSLSLLAMLGLLLSFHWGIAGVLFVVAIPTVLVRVKFSTLIHHWYRERTPLRRLTNYYSALLTRAQAAKEIRLFNLGHLFSLRVSQARRQLHRERQAILIQRTLAALVAQTVAGGVIFAAYGLIVHQTLQGQLSLGDLALYHQAFKRGQGAFSGVLGGYSQLHENSLALTNLFEFLDLQPRIRALPQPMLFPQQLRNGITFKQVSFQYAKTDRQALRDISLTIHPGETIALVGENGSGKTTLIKLLCRLYDPTAGSITIDGIDLKQFAIPDLRQHISVIFQDYVKYHLTAQENIWLGNINLAPTDDNISKAAFRSGADQVIQTLPQGYDTILGKLFDQGEELSIGQWQKIALARAFLRDSPVIVLDEPTSALDPKAEYEIFNQFRQLIKGQTAILISHRLSTVKMADRIYVMDQGSIVESGTHQELVDLSGTYAHLFETQAKNYR